MASVEVFQFAKFTNLSPTIPPILRFSPQTILPDTPDQLYCDISKMNGQIVLPYLDATRGPIYNGKEVIIVVHATNQFQLDITPWSAVGAILPGGLTLINLGETASVTAYWNENTGTGQWLINKLA